MQLNQLAILQKVDKLKNDIDSLRPFPVDVEGRVLQKLRFDWNYHSNAMEGNSLNYGETIALLMEGVTAKGKPLRDHLDIRGHNEIVYYLLDIVREKREISEADIRNLHKIMLVEDSYVAAETEEGLATRKLIKVGEYKTETNYTITETGEKNYFASPQQVPARMHELINWYRKARLEADIHPIVAAALFHYEFVAIHPFADGNGRMARWLMNLVLLQNYYPITILKQEKRKFYYVTLQKANQGDFIEFVEFVAEAVLNSLQIYQKAIKGENISEVDDLDKEIALFSKELQGREDKIEVKRSAESQKIFYENSLKPLVENLELTVRKFKGLFLENEMYFLDYMSNSSIFPSLYYNYWDSNEQCFKKYPDQNGEEYDNVLARYMMNYTNYSMFGISFQLLEFKTISTNFSISLNLWIALEDFHFNIYFDILDITLLSFEVGKKISKDNYDFLIPNQNKKFLCKKLYHNQLTSTEIQEFCTQIGQEILKLIKEKSQE